MLSIKDTQILFYTAFTLIIVTQPADLHIFLTLFFLSKVLVCLWTIQSNVVSVTRETDKKLLLLPVYYGILFACTKFYEFRLLSTNNTLLVRALFFLEMSNILRKVDTKIFLKLMVLGVYFLFAGLWIVTFYRYSLVASVYVILLSVVMLGCKIACQQITTTLPNDNSLLSKELAQLASLTSALLAVIVWFLPYAYHVQIHNPFFPLVFFVLCLIYDYFRDRDEEENSGGSFFFNQLLLGFASIFVNDGSLVLYKEILFFCMFSLYFLSKFMLQKAVVQSLPV